MSARSFRFPPKSVAPGLHAPVLYVHPNSQMYFHEIIPLSVPAIVNNIGLPTVGRFEAELTDDQIRAAQLILIDIHWYLSLPAAARLAQRIRKVNPEAKIVAGGITATAFARRIVERFPIDYVVRGDAEEPVRQLCAALIEGKGDPSRVPNLTHRDFETPQTFALDAELINRLDYQRLDFFPTLVERLKVIHGNTRRRAFSIPPYIMGFRGCPAACEYCTGNSHRQRSVFARGPVFKTGETLTRELDYLEGQGWYRSVSFFHDLFRFPQGEAEARKVFSRRRKLRMYYETFGLPSRENLGLLLSSFEGGRISFCMDLNHVTSRVLAPVGELVERVAQVRAHGSYDSYVVYSGQHCRIDPKYKKAVQEVAARARCKMKDASHYWYDPISFEAPESVRDTEFELLASNRGKRYPAAVAMARAGLFLHCIAPRLAEFLAAGMNGKALGELLDQFWRRGAVR